MNGIKYKRLVPKNEESTDVDMTRTVRISDFNLKIRSEGEFRGRAIYLTNDYDWVIGVDSEDQICLIPLNRAEMEKE